MSGLPKESKRFVSMESRSVGEAQNDT